MTIEEACCSIMGNRLATGIIADQGIAWCVAAVMAQATTADDPVAIHTIRGWVAEQKAALATAPRAKGGE